MNAITWTKSHLPHPRLPHRQTAAEPSSPWSAARRRWTIIGSVLAAYIAVLLPSIVLAQTVFGMTAAEAWGFSLGVVSYILLFSSFIAGLAWAVSHNLMDDPSRRT